MQVAFSEAELAELRRELQEQEQLIRGYQVSKAGTCAGRHSQAPAVPAVELPALCLCVGCEEGCRLLGLLHCVVAACRSSEKRLSL